MAVNITRSKIQFDTSHGGTFQELHDDTGVPYVKGSNGNHSQKILEDVDNFNYDDETLDDSVSPATGKKLTVVNEHVTKDLEIDRDAFVHRDTEIDGNVLIHGRDVHSGSTSDLIPNVTIEGTLEQQDKAHFLDTVNIEKKTTINYDPNDSNKESLQVNGTSTFNDTVYINKDLYVKGSTYDTHTEDLLVGSDFVTLRDGYEGSMGTTERAGLLVNKYDGTNDLGVLARPDGTMTVGKFNTKHVYEKDGSYFEDRGCTIAYTLPTGADLHEIGDETAEGVQEFWFTVEDDTEPLATRAEESDMENDYLTKWNSIDKNIVTSATTEKRTVDTEIRSKSNEARIADLEAGKLNIDYKTEYPVVIEKTVNSTLEQVNLNLAGFVSEYLTRVSSGDTDVYDLESKVQLYIAQNTPVTDFKYDTGVYSYSTDGGNTFTDFANPSIFYFEIGNQDSNTYSFSQNPNSVIRHFNSAADFRTELAATNAGTSTNPLKAGNVIHIADQVGIQQDVSGAQEILPVGAIGITDRIEEGNYDCVTSNAVAKALTKGQIHGVVEDSDLNINANGRSVRNVSIGTTLPDTNYVVFATVTSGTAGLIVERARAVSKTSFELTVRNLNSVAVSASFTVHWLIFQY